ncbi:hypothetical protein GQ85_39515 [Rhodococcus rhodochrous]|nr:hypothetical protein GQ85_39515 [Rhodococcus rhodochrous]
MQVEQRTGDDRRGDGPEPADADAPADSGRPHRRRIHRGRDRIQACDAPVDEHADEGAERERDDHRDGSRDEDHEQTPAITMYDARTRFSAKRADSAPSSVAPKMPPRFSSTPPVMPWSADRPASTSSFGVQLVTK